jgi:glycosyltransferase involved in cell wall biosynthesis
MNERSIRAAVWLYAVALMLITLGPASVRPETTMPSYLEHLIAFGVSGLLFAAGYPARGMILILWGGTFAAFLECFQIWVPGRHARLIDLITDASGFWVGVAVGLILQGLGNAKRSRDLLDEAACADFDQMPRSNTIVFVINSLTVGGAEHALADLLAYMEHELRNYHVHLVLLDAEKDRHSTPPWVQRHVLNANSSFFWSTVFLIRLLRRLAPAITVSFLNRANCATVIASKILGIPCILSERTHPTGRFGVGLSAFLSKMIMRLTYPSANQIVAVSEGVRADLIVNFGVNVAKICVVHNPIDTDRISTWALEVPSIKVQRPYIVSAGRLVPSKNFQLLIEAYRAAGIADNLVILGEGEARDELEALVSRLGLERRVFLPGHIQNPYPVMRNARMFVSSSNLEGFPNALIEAMALGCPVVATDCDTGPMEILTGKIEEKCADVTFAEFGILVPVNSADMLCKALRMACCDSVRTRYSDLGKKRAHDFSMQSSRDQYWSLIAYQMRSRI